MPVASLTVPTIFTAVDKFTGPVGKMWQSSQRLADKLQNVSNKANKVARISFVGGLAIAAPLAMAAKSAINFQDRMSDVSKTTGLAGLELDTYGKSLLKLSTRTRTSIDELLTIGEIGGQLGIASKDLKSFTEQANIFNVALGEDYGGTEQAITQVGKIKTLFKETRNLNPAESIIRVGSAINQLGSVGAGTSANINDFILRMGALPDAMKPSLQNTAALGTLLEEVGVDSQIGSSGYANFMSIAAKNLPGFARQLHMSGVAAKALFINDPTTFATKFAASLGKMSPDRLAKKLREFKILNLETVKVIGAMGNGTARLTELQRQSNTAFSDGTSLQNEYNTKNATVAAQLKIAQNNFEALKITIGTRLLPVISRLIKRFTPLVEKVIDWIDANPKLTETFLKVTAGFAGLLLVMSPLAGALSLAANGMRLYTLWSARVALSGAAGVMSAEASAASTTALMFGKANVAATGFFATLSEFVLPAALVALAGYGLYKVFEGNSKMRKYEEGLLKHEYFNDKSNVGLVSPFENYKEEKDYQSWFVKKRLAGVPLEKAERANFLAEIGGEADKYDLFKSNANQNPAPLPFTRHAKEVGRDDKSRIDIFLHDQNGNVQKVDVSGSIAPNVSIGRTSGKK